MWPDFDPLVEEFASFWPGIGALADRQDEPDQKGWHAQDNHKNTRALRGGYVRGVARKDLYRTSRLRTVHGLPEV